MRGLQTHDVFKAMKIVNALGIKEQVQKMANDMSNGKKIGSEKEIGVELILTILGNAGDEKAENLIYEFLSGPLEVEPNDIKQMDPMDLMELIKKLNAVIDIDAWKSFFGSVATLMK